jgi:hypothetical protein
MHTLHSVMSSPAAKLVASCTLAVLLFAGAVVEAQPRIDLARQSLTQLDQGMDGRSLSIYGVTLGMSWGEARNILDRANIPYIFQKGTSPVVYLPPQQSTYYFVLNPSSYDVIEMGIIGTADLPLDNQYLFDAQRWRLTTARTQFFGNEGEFILNEEGESYNFPFQGFVLKYLSPGSFRFVIVAPTNKPLTTTYPQQPHRSERSTPISPAPLLPPSHPQTHPPIPTPPPPPPEPMTQPSVSNADPLLQRLLDSFQEAKGYFESKEYAKALSLFKKVSEKSPDQLLRIRSIYWMGESYFGKKDYASAIKQFERVMKETDIATLRDPAQKMVDRSRAMMTKKPAMKKKIGKHH